MSKITVTGRQESRPEFQEFPKGMARPSVTPQSPSESMTGQADASLGASQQRTAPGSVDLAEMSVEELKQVVMVVEPYMPSWLNAVDELYRRAQSVAQQPLYDLTVRGKLHNGVRLGKLVQMLSRAGHQALDIWIDAVQALNVGETYHSGQTLIERKR
jgi:hypothetical protein